MLNVNLVLHVLVQYMHGRHFGRLPLTLNVCYVFVMRLFRRLQINVMSGYLIDSVTKLYISSL